MTTITTTLTPVGYKKLIADGLVNSIKFYNFMDNTHNYTDTATESLINPVIGSHYQITTSKPNFSDYRGVFNTTPTTKEVQSVTSQVKLTFTNSDCTDSFEESYLTLNINMSRWFNALTNLTTYSTNMSPGLSLDLINYVTAYIQTLNISTQSYDTSKILNDLFLSWKPATTSDSDRLDKLSPVYVTLIGNKQRQLVDNSGIRFGSPFMLNFSTSEINGMAVNGTGVNISFLPQFGYWINGNTFLDNKTVEESDLNNYKSIIPASKVGNNVYTLNTTTPYPTNQGLIGYALNMTNVNDSGETLITALVNAGKLFFKTYGKVDGSVYSMPITLNVSASNQDLNSITKIIGGEVTLNFFYDENDTTTTPLIYQ